MAKADIQQFLGLLFASRDYAHKAHLNSDSFADHMALNDFYDGIMMWLRLRDDLVDHVVGDHATVHRHDVVRVGLAEPQVTIIPCDHAHGGAARRFIEGAQARGDLHLRRAGKCLRDDLGLDAVLRLGDEAGRQESPGARDVDFGGRGDWFIVGVGHPMAVA